MNEIKIGDFTLDAKISISDDTADRCVILLNMYLRDHPDKVLNKYNLYNDNGDIIFDKYNWQIEDNKND